MPLPLARPVGDRAAETGRAGLGIADFRLRRDGQVDDIVSGVRPLRHPGVEVSEIKRLGQSALRSQGQPGRTDDVECRIHPRRLLQRQRLRQMAARQSPACLMLAEIEIVPPARAQRRLGRERRFGDCQLDIDGLFAAFPGERHRIDMAPRRQPLWGQAQIELGRHPGRHCDGRLHGNQGHGIRLQGVGIDEERLEHIGLQIAGRQGDGEWHVRGIGELQRQATAFAIHQSCRDAVDRAPGRGKGIRRQALEAVLRPDDGGGMAEFAEDRRMKLEDGRLKRMQRDSRPKAVQIAERAKAACLLKAAHFGQKLRSRRPPGHLVRDDGQILQQPALETVAQDTRIKPRQIFLVGRCLGQSLQRRRRLVPRTLNRQLLAEEVRAPGQHAEPHMPDRHSHEIGFVGHSLISVRGRQLEMIPRSQAAQSAEMLPVPADLHVDQRRTADIA